MTQDVHLRRASLFLAALALAPVSPAAAAAGRCGAPVGAPAEIYPRFCAIPQTPRGVRSAEDFKRAVVELRLTGAGLVQDSAASRFQLEGTEEFAAQARRLARPPATLSSSLGGEGDHYAAEARKRAQPPPPRR
jgi:hypothetical protein